MLKVEGFLLAIIVTHQVVNKNLKKNRNLKKKILLLSGYDAASHRYWRELLANQLTEFEWTQIALPDRFFSWRMKGNSLSFAFEHKALLTQEYDCLIVTSMVDLTTLRGFIPTLAQLPTLLYFHENQFAYPLSNDKRASFEQQNQVNFQLSSIYSLLCADRILFNSQFNRTSFYSGADALLLKLPDGIAPDLLDGAKANSRVLSVPIKQKLFCNSSRIKQTITSKKPLAIVWNHRWEHDKQPEVLFDALKKLKAANYSFKLHVLGQSFRNEPGCFELAKVIFKDEIVSWGFQEKMQYHKILATADIIISTALHDFQGISLLEGIASGCLAIAPDRVVYPEYIEKEQLYSLTDGVDESESLYNKLVDVFNGEAEIMSLSENIGQEKKSAIEPIDSYSETQLIEQYRDEINLLIECKDSKQ